jgi:hypothetical protein
MEWRVREWRLISKVVNVPSPVDVTGRARSLWACSGRDTLGSACLVHHWIEGLRAVLASLVFALCAGIKKENGAWHVRRYESVVETRVLMFPGRR